MSAVAMGAGLWRSNMKTRELYLLTAESFRTKTVHELDTDGKSIAKYEHIVSDRVGSCWAKGRLKVGDILLCDELSGDCFYNWYLMDYIKYANHEGVTMSVVPHRFGAYAMNGVMLKGFTTRDYGLLIAGQKVEVMTKLP